MVECEFCDEEFDDELDLHVHWMEEHEDELNSHQKDTAKKAKREKDEMEKKERERKKNLAFKIIASGLVIGLAVVMIPQLLNSATDNGSDSPPTGAVNFTLDDEPMLGEESANVTIVAFEDFYCPACQSFTANVKPRLEADYIETGQAKYYYMDFPLSIHEPQASAAAEAAECVYRQSESAFWDYHDALYQNQRSFDYTTSGLMDLARSSTSGIDYEEVQSCIENGEASSEVTEDFNTGVEAEVGGTPTIYVNGEQAPDFGYETISSMIERELPN
jgi:protein-disulfide isomerase